MLTYVQLDKFVIGDDIIGFRGKYPLDMHVKFVKGEGKWGL